MSDDLTAAAEAWADRLESPTNHDCCEVVEDAFLAGARWAFEQAARIAEATRPSWHDASYGNGKSCDCARCYQASETAAAIRASAAGEGASK